MTAGDHLILAITREVRRDKLATAIQQRDTWRKWALYFMLPTGMMLGAFLQLVLAKVGVS